MGKFAPSKGKSFGQCIRIGYKMPYSRFSAFMNFGTHIGIVGRLAIIKAHGSQCPKEGNFLNIIVGEFSLSYSSIIWKTGRAFVKVY